MLTSPIARGIFRAAGLVGFDRLNQRFDSVSTTFYRTRSTHRLNLRSVQTHPELLETPSTRFAPFAIRHPLFAIRHQTTWKNHLQFWH